MNDSSFLHGVRVLDLTRILAGPLCTQTLGDMGADILKIERPESGDDTRTWGPPFQSEQAAYFQSCNRNKASLALDLKSDEGQTRLHELMKLADVCIDNFPPDVRKRLGLDDTALWANNPRAISVHIGTFSATSGRANERGYDLALQAESGWLALNGEETGRGFKVGVAVLDVMTGMMASNAVIAALFKRERTSTPSSVDVSLFQTALYGLVNVAANHLVSGAPTRRWGNAHPNITPYQSFRCADREVVIAIGNDRQFLAACDVLKLPETWRQWGNAERNINRETVVSGIQDAISTMPSDELITKFGSVGVPISPILRVHEALGRVPGSLLAVEHESVGRIRMVDNPIVSESMRQCHVAPPQLNEGGEEMVQRWMSGQF